MAWQAADQSAILRPGKPFAGLLLSAFFEKGAERVAPCKVPTHKDPGQFEYGSVPYRQALGSQLADKRAAAGRNLHPCSWSEENLPFVAKRLARWALGAPSPPIGWTLQVS